MGIRIPKSMFDFINGGKGKLECNGCHAVDVPEKGKSHYIDASRLATGEWINKKKNSGKNVFILCSLGCHDEVQTKSDLERSGVNVAGALAYMAQRIKALSSLP